MLKLLFHMSTKPVLAASVFTLVLQTLFHGAPLFLYNTVHSNPFLVSFKAVFTIVVPLYRTPAVTKI